MMSDVKRYEPSMAIYEDSEGEFVSREDYAALKAERDALAAENLALINQTPDVRSISMWEAINKVEKFMDDGMPELAMVEAFEILKIKRATATDAYANQLRAEDIAAEAIFSAARHTFLKPVNQLPLLLLSHCHSPCASWRRTA